MLTNPLRLNGEAWPEDAGAATRVIGSSESEDFSDSIDCLLRTSDTEEPRGGILALSKPGVEGGSEDSSSEEAASSSRMSSS